MARKPVTGGLGVMVAGLALVGCESSQPYYAPGSRAYVASGPSAMSPGAPVPVYSSATRYYPPRISPPADTASAGDTTPKPEMVAQRPAPATEPATIPVVKLAPGADPATPMVTITLPPVKLVVPISNLYSFTPGTAASLVRTPTDQQPHATITSMTPDKPAMSPTMADATGSLQPAGATSGGSPQTSTASPCRPSGAASMMPMTIPPEEPTPSSPPSLIGPPPPAWPRGAMNSRDSEMQPVSPMPAPNSAPPILPPASGEEEEMGGPSSGAMNSPPPSWPKSYQQSNAMPSDPTMPGGYSRRSAASYAAQTYYAPAPNNP